MTGPSRREAPLHVTFVAGSSGQWKVDSVETRVGESLPTAERLLVAEGQAMPTREAAWSLRGVVSDARYVNPSERAALEAKQQPLGRPAATAAVLIPIRKSAAWWALTQPERREIFEERSRHVTSGLTALPQVSRRLHHSRDLGEPFDFLTWFEFDPDDRAVFDSLLRELRASVEWRYVDREVEIRLSR